MSNNDEGSASTNNGGGKKRAISDVDMAIWSRVKNKRQRQCAQIKESAIRIIVQSVSPRHLGDVRLASNPNNVREELLAMLKRCFERAYDPDLSHNSRRVALQTLQNVLAKIDHAVEHARIENPPIPQLPTRAQRPPVQQTSRMNSRPATSYARTSSSLASNTGIQQRTAESQPVSQQPSSEQQAGKRPSLRIHISTAGPVSTAGTTQATTAAPAPAPALIQRQIPNCKNKTTREKSAKSSAPQATTANGTVARINSQMGTSLSSFVDKAKKTNETLDSTSLNNPRPATKPQALTGRNGSITLTSDRQPRTNGNKPNPNPPPYTQASNVVAATAAHHRGVAGRRLSAPTDTGATTAQHASVESRSPSTPTAPASLTAGQAAVATIAKSTTTAQHANVASRSSSTPTAPASLTAGQAAAAALAKSPATTNQRSDSSISTTPARNPKQPATLSMGVSRVEAPGSPRSNATETTRTANNAQGRPEAISRPESQSQARGYALAPRHSALPGGSNGQVQISSNIQTTGTENNHRNSDLNSSSREPANQPQPAEKPRVDKKITMVPFIPDFCAPNSASRVSGSLKGRMAVKCSFRKEYATGKTNKEFGIRLKRWDPFWKTRESVFSGTTVPVDILEPRREPSPKCAFAGSFQLKETQIKLVKSWGKLPQPQNVKHGEWRLLCRMLPMKPNTKKRADCHLWPKGTFLVFNKKPVELTQRKQQSHDHKMWKGMCHVFDMTGWLKNPSQNNTLQMCCYDVERYLVSITMCQYQSPESVFQNLIQNVHSPTSVLQRVSFEDSMNRAMQKINGQINLFDSDNENEQQNLGSFVFSLICPISKQLMKTPVRGKQCQHFSCFDLQTWLSNNVVVSGGRWRCGCCESFFSYEDLQICELTRAALEKFGNQASQTRDRVEVFSNRSFVLSKERQLRYKKRGQNGVQPPQPPPPPPSNSASLASTRNGGNGGNNGNSSVPPGSDLIVIDSSDEE